MDGKIKQINSLLIDVYDDVVDIEEAAIKRGSFSDLSIKEIHTIGAVGIYGKKTMSELAQAMKVTMGTLTTTIDRLIRKGYVQRCRSNEDRRIVNIILTKRGKLACRVHEKFHLDMVTMVINAFTQEEEEILIRALSKLNDHLRTYTSL